MPVPRDQEVNRYAERIRERIPLRFQQVLAGAKQNPYQFEHTAGVSREMLARIASGRSIPGPCTLAQISRAAGMTITEFFRGLEDDVEKPAVDDFDPHPPTSG